MLATVTALLILLVAVMASCLGSAAVVRDEACLGIAESDTMARRAGGGILHSNARPGRDGHHIHIPRYTYRGRCTFGEIARYETARVATAVPRSSKVGARGALGEKI
jgi:hypothetical protein